MQFPTTTEVLEADDFTALRDITIRDHDGERQVVLTFALHPRKITDNPLKQPDRVFLTDGSAPRLLFVEPVQHDTPPAPLPTTLGSVLPKPARKPTPPAA